MAFNIANYIDDVALYLGLYRLPGETDESFVGRVKRFSKVKYNTDYSTQVRSIGEQVGAKIYPIAEIYSDTPYTITLDFDYLTIQTYPTDGTSPLYIRAYISPSDNIISKLQNLLADETRITLTVFKESYLDIDNRLILRESNFKLNKELVTSKDTRLLFGDIIDSLTQFDKTPFIQNRKQFYPDVQKIGDYFYDPTLGFLSVSPSIGSNNFGVAYYYYQKRFLVYASTVTLVPFSSIIRQDLNDKFISFIPQLLDKRTNGE